LFQPRILIAVQIRTVFRHSHHESWRDRAANCESAAQLLDGDPNTFSPGDRNATIREPLEMLVTFRPGDHLRTGVNAETEPSRT
jgi:hypothetical protein